VNVTARTVAVNNIGETFAEFFFRAPTSSEGSELLRNEVFHGDRTLLWLGEAKLVISSYPVRHADWLRDLGHYQETICVSPEHPSACLSEDVRRERGLRRTIVEYAGPHRRIQLIPYATTKQFLTLAETLRSEDVLSVELPECPLSLGLRNRLDTKSGFRAFISQFLSGSVTLPLGYVCYDVPDAAARAWDFLSRGVSCLVKPDDGEGGIGITVFKNGVSRDEVNFRLRSNTFLENAPSVVEEYIEGTEIVSPSVEMFVPPGGVEEPRVAYVCVQIFETPLQVGGVLIAPENKAARWFRPLIEMGLTVARALQKQGYAGYFDIDCLASRDGRVYPLEMNTRRTSGTHVHEFAAHLFGSDYASTIALLSADGIRCRSGITLNQVLDMLRHVLYTRPRQAGILLSETTGVALGRLGCVCIGASGTEVMELMRTAVVCLNE
jgi:hypothetical protein